MANVIGRVQPIQGELTVTAEYEITAEEVEAAALSTTDTTNPTDWTYGATTEDNGIAGQMDLEPGLLYNGPSGVSIRVVVANWDIDGPGIIAPDATDAFALGVYVNSLLVAECDEGVVIEQDAAEVGEFNIDTMVHNLQEGDVIRFGVLGLGEEGPIDLESEAAGEWFIT